MNRFLATIVAFCSIFTTPLTAQQLPVFTQYRDMQGIINPAALPTSYLSDLNMGAFGGSFRRQWLDMQNPPTTQVLRGEKFFANNGVGVKMLTGGYFINDQTGPTGFTGIYGRAAGVITEDPELGGLSIGLAAGAVQYRLKTSDLKLRDKEDLTAMQDRTQWYPDLSLGIFAYKRLGDFNDDDLIYGGVSVPQMIGLDFRFESNGKTYGLKRTQHYYGSLGWYHFISENSFIETSTWLKYIPNTPFNADINIRYQAANTFWIGMGSSVQGNIHAELGFVVGKNMGYDSNMRIGYGFDYSTRNYGTLVGTTHEVNLSFAF
jgi:type IX secretion system PorP/SprF family membrane protein